MVFSPARHHLRVVELSSAGDPESSIGLAALSHPTREAREPSFVVGGGQQNEL